MRSRNRHSAVPQVARRRASLHRFASGWRNLLIAALCALLLAGSPARAADRIVFVGNSFTFGFGSPVRFFHPELVHDLNGEGQGGVPALVKMFTQQAGLDWDISLETAPGKDFAYHLTSQKGRLAGKWDVVLLQDFSTLDRQNPGDPTAHVRDAGSLSEFFRSSNPAAALYLQTTWARADQVYPAGSHWFGKSLRAMTDDLVRANQLALRAHPEIRGAVPVGEAWLRAIDEGVADANPYDGIDAAKVDLWARDHYHGSAYGYYLSALVIFGELSGRDPRSLGPRERAAFELGFDEPLTVALQRIAAEALAAGGSEGESAAVAGVVKHRTTILRNQALAGGGP